MQAETELTGILPTAAATHGVLTALLEPVIRCPICGIGQVVRRYEIPLPSLRNAGEDDGPASVRRYEESRRICTNPDGRVMYIFIQAVALP